MSYTVKDLANAFEQVLSENDDIRNLQQNDYHISFEYPSRSGKTKFPAYLDYDGIDPVAKSVGGVLGPWENRSSVPNRVVNSIARILEKKRND